MAEMRDTGRGMKQVVLRGMCGIFTCLFIWSQVISYTMMQSDQYKFDRDRGQLRKKTRTDNHIYLGAFDGEELLWDYMNLKRFITPLEDDPPLIEQRLEPYSSSDTKLLTIFTTFFDSEEGSLKSMIQENVLRAFSVLHPWVNFVVFTDSPQWAEISRSYNFEVVTDYKTNEFGTPFLRHMFIQLEEDLGGNSSDFVGYVNGDILFTYDLLLTLDAVLKAKSKGQLLFDKYMLVGIRTNTDFTIEDNVPLEPLAASRFILSKTEEGELFMPNAIDFFIMAPGTVDWHNIPDFCIGRVAYDNWMLDHVFHKDDAHLIDVTATALSLHQTGTDGIKAGHQDRPDKDCNTKLATSSDWNHGKTVFAPVFTRWTEEGEIEIAIRDPPTPPN